MEGALVAHVVMRSALPREEEMLLRSLLGEITSAALAAYTSRKYHSLMEHFDPEFRPMGDDGSTGRHVSIRIETTADEARDADARYDIARATTLACACKLPPRRRIFVNVRHVEEGWFDLETDSPAGEPQNDKDRGVVTSPPA
jgi:hypothetical protein